MEGGQLQYMAVVAVLANPYRYVVFQHKQDMIHEPGGR